MLCGLFNTSTPERGWFMGSGVVIVALCMHSYARPYEDALIDTVEFVSLLSTLLIFQMGMVCRPKQLVELSTFHWALQLTFASGVAIAKCRSKWPADADITDVLNNVDPLYVRAWLSCGR